MSNINEPVLSNFAFCTIIPPDVLDHISRSDDVSKNCRDKAGNTLHRVKHCHQLRQLIQTQPPARSLLRAAATKVGLNRRLYDCKGKGGLPLDLNRDGKPDPTLPQELRDLPPWKGSDLFGEGHTIGPSDDPSAVNVYNQFKSTYDFFHDVFGRNSIDGKGLPLVGCVHYDEASDPRPGFFNAFYWLDVMAYGDGDGEIFSSFTDLIDITGHELTHGVTQYTAELAYENQAGALNESLSDVFGSMIKQWSHDPPQKATEADWLIGRGLWLIPNARALRDMANPGTAHGNTRITGGDRQPRDMDGYVELFPPNDENDWGGVHLYSGICNRAFYLVATTLGGFSWEKAGQIWYKAMNDELLRKSKDDPHFKRTAFKTFADLTVKYAKKDFPDAVKAVEDAWKEVKVYPWKTNWRTTAPRGQSLMDVEPQQEAAKSEL